MPSRKEHGVKTKHKKKNKLKPIHIILFALALAVLAVLVAKSYTLHRQSRIASDPHYGHVEVFNGDTYVWIVPDKDVELNPLKKEDFALDEEGRPTYVGGEYKAIRGIDVSQYQGDIDWQAVYDDGVRFAVIRAGGRYYGSGNIYSDDMFAKNLEGAKNAGIKVGVYFFSQAISADEAREEARYTAELIGDTEIDLPVFFDWERVTEDESRTDGLDGATLTDCAVAFCEELEALGFDAGVYVYSETAYYGYKLSELDDYTIWCSCVGNYPYFYYAHTMWQYSFKGEIDGIDHKCDVDMMFIK